MLSWFFNKEDGRKSKSNKQTKRSYANIREPNSEDWEFVVRSANQIEREVDSFSEADAKELSEERENDFTAEEKMSECIAGYISNETSRATVNGNGKSENPKKVAKAALPKKLAKISLDCAAITPLSLHLSESTTPVVSVTNVAIDCADAAIEDEKQNTKCRFQFGSPTLKPTDDSSDRNASAFDENWHKKFKHSNDSGKKPERTVKRLKKRRNIPRRNAKKLAKDKKKHF